jgi:hypothetical protein
MKRLILNNIQNLNRDGERKKEAAGSGLGAKLRARTT